MPSVGPANLARSIRAEAIASRSAARTQNTPAPVARPGALVELPPTTGGAPERPRVIVPVVPSPIARPAEQEATRTVFRAYQATRDTILSLQPLPQAAEPEVVPPPQEPARAVAREQTERPAARDEGNDQRPSAHALAGMVVAGAGALSKPLVAPLADAPASKRASTRGKAGPGPEQPAREGGWTEAVTLLTIVAMVCLGVWMLF